MLSKHAIPTDSFNVYDAFKIQLLISAGLFCICSELQKHFYNQTKTWKEFNFMQCDYLDHWQAKLLLNKGKQFQSVGKSSFSWISSK